MASLRSLRPRRIHLAFLAAALVAALAAGGCGDTFDPYSRLTKLRVLGVRAEPPTPGAGETAALDALVYAPPGSAAPQYSWSWCPLPGTANEGYPCLIAEADLDALAAGMGAGQVPPYDLGHDATAALPITFAPAAAALCQPAEGRPMIDCTGGFPVQITLTVSADRGDGSGIQTVTAVRTLRVRPDDSIAPNANPVVTELLGRATDAKRAPADGPAADTLIAATPGPALAPITVARNREATLSVAMTNAQSELYMGEDDNGNPALVYEKLYVAWFAETGDFNPALTSFIPGHAELVPCEGTGTCAQTKWTPSRARDDHRADGSASRVYAVVHDNRGGVTWIEGSVLLVDPTGAAP